jgi:hypothetical protein
LAEATVAVPLITGVLSLVICDVTVGVGIAGKSLSMIVRVAVSWPVRPAPPVGLVRVRVRV